MRKIKTGISALLICVLCLCFSKTGFAQERTAALLGYIIIPDIVQTMNKLGEIAESVDPAEYKKNMFRARVGAFLGDPELENIDRKRPIVLMLFRNTTAGTAQWDVINTMEYAAIIPVKERSRYRNALEATGIPSEINDDRIVVSSKKSSLFFAQKEMKFYRELSRDVYNCDMRAKIKIESIMSTYNSGIETALKAMQAFGRGGAYSGENPGFENQLAIGKIFLYSMLELASQSKDYQVDLSFNEAAVELASEYSAISGSPLSSFFDGEPLGDNKSFSLLPGKGEITYAGYFDMKRFRELVENLLASALKREPSLEKYINRELIDAYMDYTRVYNGEFAVTYGFNSSNRLQVNAVASTGSSSGELNATNERFMAIYSDVMKRTGGSTSGFSGYTVQKNFRKSGSADVSRYVMNMDDTKMTDMEKEMLHRIFGKEYSIEYAVSNGYVVASTDPGNLDRMIAGSVSVPSAQQLLSMKAFGTGMDSYMDFDIITFMEKIIKLYPEDASAGKKTATDTLNTLVKNLDENERSMLFSAKYSRGVSYSKCRISTKLITEVMKLKEKGDNGGADADTGENTDNEGDK